MKFCKYCGTQISEEERICPNCGKELRYVSTADDAQKKTSSTRTNDITTENIKRPKLLVGAIIATLCIVVAAITMNSGKCKEDGCSSKPVSGSDYCYSHKCAISTCSDSRFSYSNYCYSHFLLYDDDASILTNYVPSYDLKISNVSISHGSLYTTAEGIITNNSDQIVSFVKIKGSFKTGSGVVVDTDWTYAVGAEGLDSGESCKWSMSVPSDYSIMDCTVTIFDYDY